MTSKKDRSKAAKSKTLVTFLLDSSGSMQSLKTDTIGGLNAYVAKLRTSDADVRFSLVAFDSGNSNELRLRQIHDAKKIQDVPDLTDADYTPAGGTPLIDAAFRTIRTVEAAVGDRTDLKVIVAIQTDGEENTSRENSWDDLKKLVSAKIAAGWEIQFWGCGIDAYAQGVRMGVNVANTIAYGKSAVNTRAVFEASASNAALFAEGVALSTGYTDLQKKNSGDIFQPK